MREPQGSSTCRWPASPRRVRLRSGWVYLQFESLSTRLHPLSDPATRTSRILTIALRIRNPSFPASSSTGASSSLLPST